MAVIDDSHIMHRSIFRYDLLLVLFFFEILFFITGFVLSHAIAKHCKCRFPEAVTVARGNQCKIPFMIDYDERLPFSMVKAALLYKKRCVWFNSMGRIVPIQIKALHCGSVNVEVRKIRIYDYYGSVITMFV